VPDRSKRVPHRLASRGTSPLRSLAYLAHRWLLDTRYVVADVPDLGLRFKVRTRDVNGRHLYKYARYEPELTAFLTANLQLVRGDVVIDVGANLGWYCLLMERISPAPIDVFAFEPDPENFTLLTDNLRLNSAVMVTPVQQAVAERSGSLELHRYRDSNLGRHSLLPIHDGEKTRVATVSLDEFWESRGLGDRPLPLVKIDIEGYELPALRGARRLLGRCPLVLAEFSPNYMRAGGIDPAELVGYLTGLGFVPHSLRAGRLAPVEASALAGSERHTDLFWCRPGPWLRRVSAAERS
jgi:FkbM family methyltransferase